jgi:hypothetical protein
MDLTSPKIIIAIDPGASGGFAWRDSDGSLQCRKIPSTEGDILNFFQGFKRSDQTVTVWLEEVGGFIGRAQSGDMMFKFGHGCGFLRGVIMACGFRLELVRPKKWQAPLGLGGKKSCVSDNAWKNKLKAKAQQLFPGLPVTLLTADALLILDYALRNGDTPPLPDPAR